MRFHSLLRIVFLGFAVYVTSSMSSWQSFNLDEPVSETDSGKEYAITQLAISYIQDATIKQEVSRVMFCGYPTTLYLAKHPRPSKETLIKRAAEIEVNWNR